MKNFLLTASLVFLLPALGWAAKPGMELRGLEQSIREDVTGIVEKIDPRAVVSVRVIPKSTEVQLPLTPLTFENLIVRNEGGGPAIEKVEIMVYTTMKSLPPEVVTFLKQLSSLEGVPTNLDVKPLPEKVVQALADQGRPLGEEIEGVIGRATTSIIRFQQYELLGTFVFAVAILWLMFTLLRGRLGSGMASGAPNLGDQAKSLGRIAESLEQLTLRAAQGGGQGSQSPSNPQIGAQSVQALPSGGADERDTLQGLGKAGILAILSDCYWGQFDAYASYIWNRAPVQIRREIVNEYPALARYTAFLSDLEEVNLHRHNEPYYLSPYPIFHLDSAQVTDLVRKYPRLLTTLSSLRLEKLDLSAKEKVELNTRAKGELPQMGDKSMAEAGQGFQERNLSRKSAILIESVEEETEILKLRNLSFELKSQIPSLGWLLELPKEQVRGFLEKFSAQDLAVSWVGPEHVLDHLGKLLPEKKRRLVEEYREKTQPTREAPAFKELYALSLEWLKLQETPVNDKQKNVA